MDNSAITGNTGNAANAAGTAITANAAGTAAKARGRNRTLEWVKLIAAFFVVFIHVRFPGVFGEFVNSTAKFAVPFFFMVSGYYSLGISEDKIKRRALHMLKLFGVAFCLYVAYEAFLAWYSSGTPVLTYLSSLLTFRTVARLIFLGVVPDGNHLWFLLALLYCYLTLWVVRKMPVHVNNKWLYILAAFLFVLDFVAEAAMRAGGMDVPTILVRNFVLMGLPAFLLGMFIREYEDGFPSPSVPVAILFVACCLILGYVQRKGLGGSETTVAMTAFAAAAIVWCARHPRLLPDSPFANTAAIVAGKLSLYVYIVHVLINDIIRDFSSQVVLFDMIVSHKFWFPLIVVAASIAVGLIVILISAALKRLTSGKASS